MHYTEKKTLSYILETAFLEGTMDYIGKHIGDKIWWRSSDFFSDKLSEKIIMENNVISPYYEFMDIIYRLDPEKFERYAQPTGSKSVRRLTPDSSYVIMKRGLIITVSVKAYYSDRNSDNKVEYVIVKMYGPNAHRFHNFVSSILSTANTKTKIAVFSPNGFGSRLHKHTVSKISIYDTVFPTDIMRKVIRTLHKWVRDRKYYEEHKIPYKLGILLHGKPGCGKSTMIKLIASILDAPILELKSEVNLFSASFEEVKQKTNRPVVVVLEDVDFFYKDRKTDNGNNSNQHALFQLLDGLHSPENVIFIATTNFIGDLDPALVRRFDISITLRYWNEELATIYAKKLGFTKKDLNDLDLKYPTQPSFLKSLLISKRLEQ